jgi:hypothetical protein
VVNWSVMCTTCYSGKQTAKIVMGLNCCDMYSNMLDITFKGLFEMIVGVLVTCHTQHT